MDVEGLLAYSDANLCLRGSSHRLDQDVNHPLGPDRKSNPALAFPIALPTLLAKGRRWA